MKDYLTVKGSYTSETVIKHSRFIATLSYVSGREEAASFVEKVSKKYSDATHNCYAYIADKDGREVKFSDNGEPSGTAGQPILEVLKKNELFEVCVVVTRYFGGIKLGASGLVGAYSSAVVDVLNKSTLIKRIVGDNVILTCDYSIAGRVESAVYQNGGSIDQKTYDSQVKFECSLPQNQTDDFKSLFADLTKGKGTLDIKEKIFIEKEIKR